MRSLTRRSFIIKTRKVLLNNIVISGFKATLANPQMNDPRIHLRYPDFVHDPVGIIRGFYKKYGVPFGDDTETAMRNYLKHNRGDNPHGIW